MGKKMFKQKPLAAALGAALLGLAAASSAQAEVYVIGTNIITGVQLTSSSGTLTLTGTDANVSSANGATFNGSGPSISDSQTPPNGADAMPATAGPGAFAGNGLGYNPGTTTTIVGAFGDSDIGGNPLASPSAFAKMTAQARLTGAMSGNASSSGRDTFAGNIFITLGGAAASTLTLMFTSDTNLVAFSNIVGGNAKVSESARFSLTDINGTMGVKGAKVFDFAPSGLLASGGAPVAIASTNTTETADPFSLNREISSLGTQGQIPADGSNSKGGLFSAFTSTPLLAGTYRIDLLLQTSGSVSQAAGLTPVPEPSSVPLVALALTALGITKRRKTRR